MTSEVYLSLVVPVFDEAESLRELQSQVTGALSCVGFPYEIIYIDDGSSDGPFEVLSELARGHPSVRVIRLRRNFGQTPALAAGFDHARGEVIVTLDADLQNDPADIPRLLEKLQEGYDVVSGWRRKRQDPLSKRIPSHLANWLISRVTGLHLRDYGCTLKAYRKEIVRELTLFGEMHRFIPALAFWSGARVAELAVNHRARSYGQSKYGLLRVIKVALDLITVKFLLSYYSKPAYIFGGIGLLGLLLSLVFFLIQAYRVLILGRLEATPIIFLMVIAAVAGVQFILMGLLAEMFLRTGGAQEKRAYFVQETINFG